MKLILIFLSFFAFSIAPTFSQNLTEVVQLQLLKGWRAENGTHISGLKITLSPGWKTYWKQPGETGLVPHFDWTGSKNVSAVKSCGRTHQYLMKITSNQLVTKIK